MFSSLVVDKSKIYSDELKNNKNSFYSYFIKEVLQNSNDKILDAKIRIDGSGDRSFKRNFVAYLRRELNSKQRIVMKNCKFVDSKNNVLIQMADMVAGSINRAQCKNKEDAANYLKIIKSHLDDIWNFK
ncbi:MAG: hypothetical protein BWY51_00207 [Parcubacteria group bacterium ADurb.Bin316]|nr:MAG: hypothetical protein BWY51_00207 [Parcubacteria group bacterium ADurb.Bin316]HOZ55794.1 DUF3800 domain-containing protein [bacterium]